MSVRNDIQFEPELSPRLVSLDNSSNALIIQDLHDTIRNWEDELHLGMAYDALIDSAGKEDLGAGVEVGITSTLQNTQLEFEPRTTPLSSGTATSGGTTTLTDTGATFLADGVSRGDVIINFTDFSMASVLSVDSEMMITHRILTGGTNDDWTSADVYRVYDVEQVEISGGNLVAVDDLDDVMDSILPSFGTQVIRSLSSSSTITNIASIETQQILIRKIIQNRSETNPATGVMTVFNDDGITPFLTANIFEDVAGLVPYSIDSKRLDRKDALS